MESSSSLSAFARLIVENGKALRDAYPSLAAAAEAVHQGFDGLLSRHTRVDPDSIPVGTVWTMAFGAHLGWVDAYIMTAGGHTESGWADMRRSIEFTCYAAKIIDTPRRAKDWMQQRSHVEARKRFASACAIPLCYQGEKYRMLRPLLVAYDAASYSGSHANLETLARKYRNAHNGYMVLSYQDNAETIPVATGLIVLLGYQVLSAFTEFLEQSLEDKGQHSMVMAYVAGAIRDARLDLANQDYGGAVPRHVLRAIHSGDNPEIDRMFQELIDREERRRSG